MINLLSISKFPVFLGDFFCSSFFNIFTFLVPARQLNSPFIYSKGVFGTEPPPAYSATLMDGSSAAVQYTGVIMYQLI